MQARSRRCTCHNGDEVPTWYTAECTERDHVSPHVPQDLRQCRLTAVKHRPMVQFARAAHHERGPHSGSPRTPHAHILNPGHHTPWHIAPGGRNWRDLLAQVQKENPPHAAPPCTPPSSASLALWR